MTECPDLGALEHVPLAPPVSAHVATCAACKLVVDVFSGASVPEVSECLRFDALLAARHDGTLNTAGKNLLDRHLAGCAECRDVAETLSPTADADGDLESLPRVDPAGYALGLEINRGGMGRILAARDLRVGRPVAVKELLGRAPKLAARFEREARVTARLQHPGIVPIYEIGQWPDGTPFYSMRMVLGRTLLEAIDAAPTLSARLALLPKVIAATEAVAFAHAQRVIHRDLTPSNVLVGAYGETVVIDWGLAKDLSQDAEPDPDDEDDPPAGGSTERLTNAGAVIGTAAYMPPEQAHGAPVDERADVYALGAILYHLLAGAAPYRAKSTRELLRDVRTGPPPSIGELAPGAPRDLVSIVDKAMARELDARYPSARELTEELNRFQTGRMVAAHAYSGLERALRVLRRNRAVVSVAALALVLLGAMSTIAVTRVLRSRTEARETVRELLVEEGRVELLSGNPLRALAYLHEAARQHTSSPALGFLITSALDAMPRSQRLLDCKGDVRFLEFSPDSAQVIAACHDVAQLWTMANGNAIATLGPLPAAFDRVRFSHDGNTLVTFGDSGDARVWDAHTGLALGVLPHGAPITAATYTPDDRRIATTGQDGTAQLWDVATSTRLWKIVGNTGLLRHIYGEISGDGTLLLTVTMEGEAKGWDLATGEQRGGFRHAPHAFVLGAELSRDGARAVTCGTDRLTRVWDARTGAPLLTVGGHTDVVWKCVFSPDGARLLTASHDGTALVWDVETGATIAAIRHGDVILWARFSPDGARFLTVGVEGLIKVWDARSGAPLSTHDSVGGKDAHFSPDGRHLIAQRGDGRIQIWSEAPQVRTFTPPPVASMLAVSTDGTRTALSRDGLIELHDTATGRAIAHVEIRAPLAMAEHELAATTERAVVVLDLATGATKHVIPMAAPTGLEVSEDGARIVVTRTVGPPELWDVESGQKLAVIEGAAHAKPSRTGRRVLAWRPGAPPFVWDDTRGRLATIPARGTFTPLGFSATGDRVAIVESEADATRRLRVWNTDVTTFPVVDTTDISEQPSFDPSGVYITTIGGDRIVTVWNLDSGSVHAAFATDHLVQAQINAAGTLLAGIGDSGASLLVLSADGRLLQRSPIAHAAPLVSQLGFRPPAARAWWTPAGDAVVTRSTSIGLWPASTAYDPATLDTVVAHNVPWRVARGTLAWIESVPLRVVVVRDDLPVAGAAVEIELRMPAHRGAAPMDYDTMSMRRAILKLTTDANGEIELPSMPPARYQIRARQGSAHGELESDIGVDNTSVTVTLAPS